MRPVCCLAEGTLLGEGRYRVVRESNRGGTAVVYEAEDLCSGGEKVALKVLNGPQETLIRCIKQEILFSSSFQHDNIVQLLNTFDENNLPILVFEYVSGPDLNTLINEQEARRLPEDVACFFFIQLLKAVMFMHENGFCHRDIKIENAMVIRDTYQLKLIDFGLSKHLESVNTLRVGTTDYMCPEMWQRCRRSNMPPGRTPVAPPPYDAKAVDAWAMGVLLYLLVTGKYPFEDPSQPDNCTSVVTNIMAGHVQPFPAHISLGCQHLIRGLLMVRPSQRTTLRELANNVWLEKQALLFARKVGREGLVRLDEYKAMHLANQSGPSLGGLESATAAVGVDSTNRTAGVPFKHTGNGINLKGAAAKVTAGGGNGAEQHGTQFPGQGQSKARSLQLLNAKGSPGLPNINSAAHSPNSLSKAIPAAPATGGFWNTCLGKQAPSPTAAAMQSGLTAHQKQGQVGAAGGRTMGTGVSAFQNIAKAPAATPAAVCPTGGLVKAGSDALVQANSGGSAQSGRHEMGKASSGGAKQGKGGDADESHTFLRKLKALFP